MYFEVHCGFVCSQVKKVMQVRDGGGSEHDGSYEEGVLNGETLWK